MCKTTDPVECYRELFRQATGRDTPFPYQERLALSPPDDLACLLDVPTGLGKTAAAVLAWVYRRRFADQEIRVATPRRLVYCLPMRVLVEQTYGNTVRWLQRLGLLAGEGRWSEVDDTGLLTSKSEVTEYVPALDAPMPDGWAAKHGDQGTYPIPVHLLMGGEERTDWAIWPERDAVLIGTQDMLVSRALNRGYGDRRAKWPVEFGLLNTDCWWVLDEVQLMGNAVATSAQLDAFRKSIWRPLFSCPTLWMSATLGDEILQTRDREDLGVSVGERLSLSDEEREQPAIRERLHASKTVEIVDSQPKPTKRDGSGILDQHVHGRISLVIVNTVPTAQTLFSDIQNEIDKRAKKKVAARQPKVLLLHGRLRSADRRERIEVVEQFIAQQDKATGDTADHPGLILVSTQVIEAGYDLSAARLWSEVAPWPSIVQRLGRLNREGLQPEARAFFWMPKADAKGENDAAGPNAKRIGPYAKADVHAGLALLESLCRECEAGGGYRNALDRVLATDASRRTLYQKADAVLRPDDFFGLFSTEPDLAGGYTNVSPFVRSVDRDSDLLVYWRSFAIAEGPSKDEASPSRNELCAVPFFAFRKFLQRGHCWEWDFETGQWQRRRAGDISPGMTILLPASQGGYSSDLGWTGRTVDAPVSVIGPPRSVSEPDSLDGEPGCEREGWVSLPNHMDDVTAEVEVILRALAFSDQRLVHALRVAARWHDRGKSLARWQDKAIGYVRCVLERIDTLLGDRSATELHDAATRLRPLFTPPNSNNIQWAKFPNLRRAVIAMNLEDEVASECLKRVRAAFVPGVRHEAASALAAWDAWRQSTHEMTALAVYLIAAHHGKVRTALRSRRAKDQVFGLQDGDSLSPVPPHFEKPAELTFAAKVVGLQGTWDDSACTFAPSDPSWTSVVTELVGPPPDGLTVRVAISADEPASLGPIAIAYLEAILRAADGRASDNPRMGARL